MNDDATNQIITLGTTDKTYTFTFTNWVSAKEIKTSIMLGAFNAQYDYAGNSVSAVSYTHLDVYKRQELRLLVLIIILRAHHQKKIYSMY